MDIAPLIIPQLIMRSTKGYPLTENPLFWMVCNCDYNKYNIVSIGS